MDRRMLVSLAKRIRGMAHWLKRASSVVHNVATTLLRSGWLNLAKPILEGALLQTVLLILVVFGIHHLAFLFADTAWLPNGDDVNSFLKTLWQIHATVLALSAVVVTVIVTIMANERDRAQTWNLYLDKTKVGIIVRFNLVLLGSEGLAVIQTYSVTAPLVVVPSTQGIILAEVLFFACSLVLLGYLFMETFRFLDPDYVETLAEQRIAARIPDAVRDDLKRHQLRHSRMFGGGSHGT